MSLRLRQGGIMWVQRDNLSLESFLDKFAYDNNMLWFWVETFQHWPCELPAVSENFLPFAHVFQVINAYNACVREPNPRFLQAGE